MKKQSNIMQSIKMLCTPVNIILICLLILFLLCSFYEKSNVYFEYSEKVDLSDLVIKGYNVDENTFSSCNNDPQIYIPSLDKPINLVCISFSEPMPKNSVARLYYSVDNNNLSEENAFNINVSSDGMAFFVQMPDEALYSKLRFDLTGNFSVDKIERGKGTVETKTFFDFKLFFISWIIILSVFAVYKKYSDKFARIFNPIVKRLYTTNGFEISEEEKTNLAKWYLYIAICFGILIAFLNPPLCASDEAYHFNHVCQISRLRFFSEINDGRIGIWNSYDEANFERMYHMDYEASVELSYYAENRGAIDYAMYGPTSPIGYLVPGLGLAVMRLLIGYLSPYTAMMIGRIINLVFSSFLISISIKKSKAYNNTMFLIALMPMTLYQCASLSYDATVISATFLLFAYITKILRSDDNYYISLEDIVAVSVACFFLSGSKSGAYAPVIITLFSLSVKKFGTKKRFLVCCLLEGIICILSYGIPSYYIRKTMELSNQVEDILITQQKAYLSNNLNIIPDIIYKTWEHWGQKYWEGFIGYLGWQDVRLPYFLLLLFTVVLILSVLIEGSCLTKVNIKMRFLTFVGTLISFLGIVLIMYLEYAPLKTQKVGGLEALGVQGRYFIPIFAFAIIIIANPLLYKFRYTKKIFDFESHLVKITSISSCVVTIFTMIAAYWL